MAKSSAKCDRSEFTITEKTVRYFVELCPLIDTSKDVVKPCSNVETFRMETYFEILVVKGKISPRLNSFRRTVQVGYFENRRRCNAA